MRAGFTNPVLSGCYPDPSVVRVGDEYFLVTSSFEYFPGLPVFRSTDLVGWEQIGHAIDRPDQIDLSTVPSSGGLFAPTIRFHDGTFYIANTLVHGSGRQGNFLIKATDPAGPWSDPIWLDEAAGIDPSILFDVDPKLDASEKIEYAFIDRISRLAGPDFVIGPTGSTQTPIILTRLNDAVLFGQMKPADAATQFVSAIKAAISQS